MLPGSYFAIKYSKKRFEEAVISWSIITMALACQCCIWRNLIVKWRWKWIPSCHVPRPPQLAPLSAEDQRLYFEPLLYFRTSLLILESAQPPCREISFLPLVFAIWLKIHYYSLAGLSLKRQCGAAMYTPTRKVQNRGQPVWLFLFFLLN